MPYLRLYLKRIITACIALALCSCVSFAGTELNCYDLIITGIRQAAEISGKAMQSYESTIIELEKEKEERLRELGYPEGFDPDNPVAMGEVDPWDAYNAQQAEEMDKAMAEDAQKAWREYYEPEHDISDQIIKP